MPFASLKKTQERLEGNPEVVDWQFRLIKAPCNNPAGCCTAFCCTCCVACQQRQRILDFTNTKYACCGGSFCCCPCPEIDPPMDKLCMCLESSCFPFLATMVNRDLVMGHFLVKFDPCDEYLITCAVCLQWIVCLLQCFGVDVPQEIEDLIDFFTTLIMSCSLAQQAAEIDFQTGTEDPNCGWVGGGFSKTPGAGRHGKDGAAGGAAGGAVDDDYV